MGSALTIRLRLKEGMVSTVYSLITPSAPRETLPAENRSGLESAVTFNRLPSAVTSLKEWM